jgi:hypothetical protein
MHAAGRSLEEIGDYVGHSSAYMTDRYRHLLDGARTEAASALESFLTAAQTAGQARLTAWLTRAVLASQARCRGFESHRPLYVNGCDPARTAGLRPVSRNRAPSAGVDVACASVEE